MLKARLLLIIGIWTALLPYLGFPITLKNLLFSITGVFLIYISFVVYKEVRLKKPTPTRRFENFSESVPKKIKDMRKAPAEIKEEVNETNVTEQEQF